MSDYNCGNLRENRASKFIGESSMTDCSLTGRMCLAVTAAGYDSNAARYRCPSFKQAGPSLDLRSFIRESTTSKDPFPENTTFKNPLSYETSYSLDDKVFEKKPDFETFPIIKKLPDLIINENFKKKLPDRNFTADPYGTKPTHIMYVNENKPNAFDPKSPFTDDPLVRDAEQLHMLGEAMDNLMRLGKTVKP